MGGQQRRAASVGIPDERAWVRGGKSERFVEVTGGERWKVAEQNGPAEGG